LEAEDADGDTALHLVLLQIKNNREAAFAMTFLLNVLFRVEPKNMDKAPAISKARLQIIKTQRCIKYSGLKYKYEYKYLSFKYKYLVCTASTH